MEVSKDLLSEVLGYTPFKIDKIKQVGGVGLTLILLNQDGTVRSYQNIYELAHKCKEWASELDYEMESATYRYNKGGYCFVSTFLNNTRFEARTEVEAIFLACEYILNNIKH